MQRPLANSEATHVREILSFSGAELQENTHGINKITDVGVLHVLYFPQYNQFILELNNWSYALLKQIPVTISARGLTDPRCYIFPNEHGFYIIKLKKIPHLEAVQNFDTILSHNASLMFSGDPMRSGESSPAYSTHHSDISTPSSARSEVFSSAGKLGNRETIKKGFKKIASKLSGNYSTYQENSNFVQVKDYESLKNFGSNVPGGHLIKRGYVESVVMNGKNIIGYLGRRKSMEARFSRCQKPMGDNNDSVDSAYYKVGEILAEIEKEKQLQAQEISLQEEHRRKEIYYIEKERELLDLIRKQAKEEFYRREQLTMSEVIKRESEIAQESKNWELEVSGYRENEKLLQTELQRNLDLIYEQEKLSEEERFHFGQRGMELIQKSKQLELALADLKSKQEELLRETVVIEEQHQSSFIVLETKEIELENKQREISTLQAEMEKRWDEIQEREIDVETELLRISTRNDEIQRLIELGKNEVLELQSSRLEREKRIEEQASQVREKEAAFEIEQTEFQQKYSQFVGEIERKRAELKEKEQRVEADFVKVISKQEELKQSLKIREEELLIVRGQRQELEKENETMERKLSGQIEAIEKECERLKQREGELLKAIQLQSEQIKNLEEEKKQLLNDVEQRMNMLAERKNKAEAELAEAQLKGKNLQKELLKSFQELSVKERLREEEHQELRKRLEELTMLEKLGEAEIKEKFKPLDRLRLSEAQLVCKNVEIIQGHQILNQELLKMAESLEDVETEQIKTSTRTRQERSVEKARLETNRGNVTTDLVELDTTNMNMAHSEA